MAQTATRTPPATVVHRSSALVGLAAAAVALGVGALVAVPFGPSADSRTAIGSSVIDLTPGPAKEWAIQTFGTNDKLFLTVMVLVVIAVIAAIAGRWERSRIPVGSLVIALAAVAGSVAVVSRPSATLVDVIPTVVGAACGIATLRCLTSGRLVDGKTDATDPPETRDGRTRSETVSSRRSSLAAIGFLGAGVLSGVAGAVLSRRLHSVSSDRTAFTPPTVAKPIPPPPPSAQPAGVALPSYVTSNKDFYRIDTALSVPQLGRADWKLKIHGMVDREITYRFDDLGKFDLVQKMVTLTCVSNPVGGNLISNAVWTGYRVRDLLAAAGIHPDADMVLSTSVDGFTAGTPVDALTDGREALLAITMNGTTATHRARLPRAAGGARALRLCLGDQVDRRYGTDPVRPRRGLLDGVGLVTARADQDRVPRGRPPQRTSGAARPRQVWRGGVGAAAWGGRRGGARRRRPVAAHPIGGQLQRRCLAVVELRLAGPTGRAAPRRRAGHRQHRRGTDLRAG